MILNVFIKLFFEWVKKKINDRFLDYEFYIIDL